MSNKINFNGELVNPSDVILDWIDEPITNVPANWVYLSQGRHRFVYKLLNKNFVVKVPKNSDGHEVNKYEEYLYRRFGYSKNYARCRCFNYIVDSEHYVCLLMEYIEPLRGVAKHTLPEWAQNIDCQQVGYNRHGKLLAYDYGGG